MTDATPERVARRIQSRGDHALDILVLSGGAQFGAYSTGFLRGWQTRRDEPMPKFDVVTGISTGSLIAPFAFLGTPEALGEITRYYTEAVEEIKPSSIGFSSSGARAVSPPSCAAASREIACCWRAPRT